MFIVQIYNIYNTIFANICVSNTPGERRVTHTTLNEHLAVSLNYTD